MQVKNYNNNNNKLAFRMKTKIICNKKNKLQNDTWNTKWMQVSILLHL